MSMYHYTCAHFRAPILADGLVKPNPLTGLAWFTDLYPPIPTALGLTGHMLNCDRTMVRVEVDPADVVPWVRVRRDHGLLARLLESAPGAMPMHWYVSDAPVPIRVEN